MKIKDLKTYKENLYVSLSRDLSAFEKNFILISGAILAFSVTFIREIVNIKVAEMLILLYVSWGLIIVSIALMMFTFLESSSASDRLWKVVDDFIISNQLFEDETTLSKSQAEKIKGEVNDVFHKSKKQLKNIRYGSVIIFVTGLILLGIFVAINLNKENKAHEVIGLSSCLESPTYYENNKIISYEYNQVFNTN